MRCSSEFNIDHKSDVDVKLDYMQKKIEDMDVSMGKMRRKLFSQIGELSSLCMRLQNENHHLKSIMHEAGYGKTNWNYGQRDCLFDLSKS